MLKGGKIIILKLYIATVTIIHIKLFCMLTATSVYNSNWTKKKTE